MARAVSLINYAVNLPEEEGVDWYSHILPHQLCGKPSHERRAQNVGILPHQLCGKPSHERRAQDVTYIHLIQKK